MLGTMRIHHPTHNASAHELYLAMWDYVPKNLKLEYGSIVWVHVPGSYCWPALICDPTEWLNMGKFADMRQLMIDNATNCHLCFFYGTKDVAIVQRAYMEVFKYDREDMQLFVSIGASLCSDRNQVDMLHKAFDEASDELLTVDQSKREKL